MKRKYVNLYRFGFILLIWLALWINPAEAAKKETITFLSADSLLVTADLYAPNPQNAPFIILFHQAGWSRGEYLEIVPKLNKIGFNCMAVDQRSGGEVNGVLNQTHKWAVDLGKPVEYLNALPDMKAAVAYVKSNYPHSKIILWGSSYSAALVLKLAGDFPNLADGVLSFSPGEYFKRFGVGANFISKSAKHIKCPLFITSKKKEASGWKKIFDAVPGKQKQFFIPNTEGNHGSRALWSKFPDSGEYWRAVKRFLIQFF